MVTSKTGSRRRRWTSKQRQRLLALFHKNEIKQRDFAVRHGVGLSTLSKWLRLERDAVPSKIKFQEVRLPNPASRWPVEVVSPQGWIVRLQHSSDVQSLPKLCIRLTRHAFRSVVPQPHTLKRTAKFLVRLPLGHFGCEKSLPTLPVREYDLV